MNHQANFIGLLHRNIQFIHFSEDITQVSQLKKNRSQLGNQQGHYFLVAKKLKVYRSAC